MSILLRLQLKNWQTRGFLIRVDRIVFSLILIDLTLFECFGKICFV